MNFSAKLFLLFLLFFTSCAVKNHPRKELLKTYITISGSDSLFIKDSLYKYYNKDGKLIKLIHPAHEFKYSTKYGTSALFKDYNKKGQLVREYSYYGYSEDPNDINSLQDSILLFYDGDQLTERREFLNGVKSKPRIIRYSYKNGKITHMTDSHKLDSVTIKYPKNNQIKKTHYTYGDLCYEENIKALTKLDTLTKLNYNELNEDCGFYSDRSIRKIYEKNGDIKFKIMKGYIESHRFSFYDRGNIIKICADSLQTSCETEYEYEYDHENNWITRTTKFRGEISKVEKRFLTY